MFVTFDQIMEKYHTSPVVENQLQESEAKEFIAECLREMQIINVLYPQVVVIDVENHKARLPENIAALHEVSEVESGYPLIEDPFLKRELSYNNQGSYLYFKEDHDQVRLNYTSYPVDIYGKPLIKDDPDVINAILYYFKYKKQEQSLAAGKDVSSSMRHYFTLYRDYIKRYRNRVSTPTLQDFKRFRHA